MKWDAREVRGFDVLLGVYSASVLFHPVGGGGGRRLVVLRGLRSMLYKG